MLIATLPISPADSARAVARVYTISLAATVPLVAAAVAAIAVRRRPAGTRSLVWRCAVVALLVVYAGHLLPARWVAWILPGALASPVIALGRAEVIGDPSTRSLWLDVPPALRLVYWLGVLVAAWPVLSGWMRVRALVARARPFRGRGAVRDLVSGCMGIRGGVRVLIHDAVRTPIACGVVAPVIVLPSASSHWNPERLRAVLLHEMAHVASRDVAFGMAARLAAALYWFHPAAWLFAHRLHAESELACDDRVLAAGVRPSDYAGMLAAAADDRWGRAPAAVAMSGRAGLRERLAAIVDTRRDLRAPSRVSLTVAVALTIVVSAPAGLVQFAPTRGVLTTLMADARWDTRAYAVLRLAQRPDSIGVARAAATGDPSPRVRAWARFAIGQARVAPAAAISTTR